VWLSRARLNASERQWSTAITEYSQSLELLKTMIAESDEAAEASTHVAVITKELAAVRLLNGDRAGYRQLCETIVEQHGQTEHPIEANCFSGACTLSDDAVSDWSIPLVLASRSAEKQPRLAWTWFALGIAQYRAGQDEEAVQTLRNSLDLAPEWDGRGQNHVVLALACHRLGRTQEARQWLARARDKLNTMNRTMANNQFGFASSFFLIDWMSLNILLEEAEQRLAARQSPTRSME
jgi:tetratricopeptide (TPR) repeat protein